MAKKKVAAVDYESVFDEMFEASTDAQSKKYPTAVYTGPEEEARAICLAVPNLSCRYFLQQEGWPLGRYVIVAGPKESCKSAFTVETVRWARLQQGRGIAIEVEDKRSPTLGQSLLNYDPKALKIQRCMTMQEWNAALLDWIKKMDIVMMGDPDAPKSRPGIGRRFPVQFIVDSIMAATSEGVADDIDTEGHDKRRFAEESGLLSGYLKHITKKLSDRPFNLIGVNHVKPTMAPGQHAPTRHMPGGKAPEYHASFDINIRASKQWNTTKLFGKTLTIQIEKNSMGAHAAPLEVDMVWCFDDECTDAGEYLQRTWFDWDQADWQMLKKFAADCGVDKRAKLKTILDFKINDKQGSVQSDALGLHDFVDYKTASKLLEERIKGDETFTRELYALLGIQRRYIFKPGVELGDQMDEARADIKQKIESRQRFIQARGDKLPTENIEPSIPYGDSPLDDTDDEAPDITE